MAISAHSLKQLAIVVENDNAVYNSCTKRFTDASVLPVERPACSFTEYLVHVQLRVIATRHRLSFSFT